MIPDWDRVKRDGPSVALAGGIVLVVLVVGLQVGDPLNSPPGPERVDLSESPDRIAVDALRVLHRVNHTERVVLVTNASEVTDPSATVSEYDERRIEGYRQFSYEPRKNRYLAFRSYDEPLSTEPEIAAFGRENTGWAQISSGKWEESGHERYPFWEPFDPSAIGPGDVTVHSETESKLVLAITNRIVGNAVVSGTVAWQPEQEGRLFLSVDKETRRLDRVVFTTRTALGSPARYIFEIEAYGRTRAPPPEGVPAFSVAEAIRDVTNGPLFKGRKISRGL